MNHEHDDDDDCPAKDGCPNDGLPNDDWTGDVYRPRDPRKALLKFADAIGSRRKLGEDEAGNPRIEGRRGRIYVQPSTTSSSKPVFQVYYSGTPQSWRHAKAAIIRFAKLTNDGDTDGMFTLTRLPTKAQSEVLRDKLMIAKRKEYSEATLTAMRTRLEAARAAREPLNSLAAG